MAKVRKYTMAWIASPDPDVVTYYVRATQAPDEPTYETPYDNVGKVTQCDLPLPHTPLIDGDLTIALTAVDDVGNESDMVMMTVPFDLVAPAPPSGLRML